MVRVKSKFWDYFVDRNNKVMCRFCKRAYSRNPSRMPAHLIRCIQCPSNIKQLFSDKISQSCLSLVEKSNVVDQTAVSDKDLKDQDIIGFEQYNVLRKDHDFERIDDIEIVNDDGDPDLKKTHVKVIAIESNAKESKTADEFSVLGELVTHRLRKIKDPEIQCITQRYINEILYQAEMTTINCEHDSQSDIKLPLFEEIKKKRRYTEVCRNCE